MAAQRSQRRASMGSPLDALPPFPLPQPQAPSRRSMSAFSPYAYAAPSSSSTSSLLPLPTPTPTISLCAPTPGYFSPGELVVSRPRTPSLSHVDPAAASTLSLPSVFSLPPADLDRDLQDIADPSSLSLSSTRTLLPHPATPPDALSAPSSLLAVQESAPGQPHDRLTVPALHEQEKADLLAPSPDADDLDSVDLDEPLIDWRALRNWRTYCQWCHWPKYAVLFFLIATSVPIAIEHKPLVDLCRPWITALGHMPAGWMIPIVILFIISFPPLFGHEIIAVLVGLVWGFGLGFIIVSVGSVLGEIGNFYAFRYLLGPKGHKTERTNLRYACLARIVREGGFVIAVVTRLSAVPGHLTTAVFSTCGMSFLTFTAAAALSMPKQMVTVYLGVALLQSADGHMSPKNQAVSAVVILITVLVTIFAALWIYWKMSLAYPVIVAERRLARERRALARARLAGTSDSLASLSALPLPELAYNSVGGGAGSPPLDEKKGASDLSLPRLDISVSSYDSSSSRSPPRPAAGTADVELSEAPRKGFAALVHRLRARAGTASGAPRPGPVAAADGAEERRERRPPLGRAISDLVIPGRRALADPEKAVAPSAPIS